jgi:hypothetical protein
MPAKAHRPDKKSRDQVRTLAGMGTRHEDIARVMGVSGNTLVKHYRDELDCGGIEANAKVAESLFKKATGSGQGSVTAAIFWLKCRARWKEVSVHEHVGAEGGAIEVADARNELMGLIARQQEAVAESAEDKPPARRRRKKAAKKKAARRVPVRKKPRG